jgi:hypothetical protein
MSWVEVMIMVCGPMKASRPTSMLPLPSKQQPLLMKLPSPMVTRRDSKVHFLRPVTWRPTLRPARRSRRRRSETGSRAEVAGDTRPIQRRTSAVW